MTFIRKIKQRGKIYYAEVENQWIDGKCVQKHIRSLGTDPENPTNIGIEPTHFSYLSLRLMQGSLSPNDLFEMLENMGQPMKKADLKRLGIHYDFKKKRTLSPYFTRRTQNEELQEAKQLIRKFPQHPLVKSDVKRPEILRDFVALVEDEFNDVPEADISRWLSNFIDTDARLTP